MPYDVKKNFFIIKLLKIFQFFKLFFMKIDYQRKILQNFWPHLRTPAWQVSMPPLYYKAFTSKGWNTCNWNHEWVWSKRIPLGLKCSKYMLDPVGFMGDLNGKKYQRIPPWTLNLNFSLGTPTKCAHAKIMFLRLLQPGGAAIIFPKKWLKLKMDNTLNNKKPGVAPTIWKRNFVLTLHIENMNIFSRNSFVYRNSKWTKKFWRENILIFPIWSVKFKKIGVTPG